MNDRDPLALYSSISEASTKLDRLLDETPPDAPADRLQLVLELIIAACSALEPLIDKR